MTSSDDFGLKKFTHNFVCKRPCVIDIAKRGWGGGGEESKEGATQKKTYNKLIHEKNSIASFYYRCNIENVIGIILST